MRGVFVGGGGQHERKEEEQGMQKEGLGKAVIGGADEESKTR